MNLATWKNSNYWTYTSAYDQSGYVDTNSGGSISAGTKVNSYQIMLHHNVSTLSYGSYQYVDFSNPILGIYTGDSTGSSGNTMRQVAGDYDAVTSNTYFNQILKNDVGGTNATYNYGGKDAAPFEDNQGDWIAYNPTTYRLYFGATNSNHSDVLRVITAAATDGDIVGMQYFTTSGISGITDAQGQFTAFEGDHVYFFVGSIYIGMATSDEIQSGQIFLQDIADVARSNLNDEYVENMAVFLQSIDDNNNAYDNIVITQEMRDKLMGESLDLRTAGEQEVKDLIDRVGGNYVDEDAAMQHVKDILMQDTGMTEADFDERTPDHSDIAVESLLVDDSNNVDDLISDLLETTETQDEDVVVIESDQENTDEIFDEQLEQDIAAINMIVIAQPELQQPEIII